MNNGRNIFIWIALFFLIMGLFQIFGGGTTTPQGSEITYSQAVDQIEGGSVNEARLDGERMILTLSDCLLYTSDAADD